MVRHRELDNWVREMAELCRPERVVWIDGSKEQQRALTDEAVRTGELTLLNQEKLPGCLYHRTAPNDVARTEHLTYICTPKREEAGPTNNWMPPSEAYAKAREYFKCSMKGRTMYVIPFSMGPVGSPFSKVGVQLTDSIYVVLNMLIMTRVGNEVLDVLGSDGQFTKCLHSKAQLDINKRLILHFPQDNTIWSVNSGYGGNVLLGKKCLGLRLASYMARDEGWMAEHMLILGIEEPSGYIAYVAAAFPSACGKTNLAMMVVPKALRRKGYRIWTVGDDIAWMRIDTDGALWAVNPETGFFGVAPGTNSRTNPNAVAMIKSNTIFTNVLLKKDGTVWWEGADGPVPSEGINWEGKPWRPGLKDEHGRPVYGAHPNSRFTVSVYQCPTISFRLEHHHGVPISAIIFGGRRAKLGPLVYEAFNWQHGVFIGATMGSEITAAQYGDQGAVRRDPMAMLPFCGYNMADYFRHWLDMGRRMKKPPRIFHVNWFRTDEDGNYLWPGYGENLRVIEWIVARTRNQVGAVVTPIGYMPDPADLDLNGISLSPKAMKTLFSFGTREEWLKEADDIERFFKEFDASLPKELWDELHALRERLRSWES